MVIRMKIPVNINITTERLTENGPYGVDGAETERIESSASGIMKKTGNMLQLQYIEAEDSGFGGVRCLVKRALVPAGWALERPTVEDIVLFLVKGAKEQ